MVVALVAAAAGVERREGEPGAFPGAEDCTICAIVILPRVLGDMAEASGEVGVANPRLVCRGCIW